MGDLARWQPSYYMQATTSITESADFSTATAAGTYGVQRPIVYVSNNPTFDINQEIISTRKSTGNAYLIKGGTTAIERYPGIESPSSTFEFDFDPAAAFIPLVTLFQDVYWTSGGTSSGSTATDVKYINPYTGSTVAYFANILRKLDGTNDQLIKGSIAKSVTIKGEEGAAVTMSVEWVGSDFSSEAVTVVAWGTSHCADISLFKDMICKYGTGNTASTAVDIIGFDLTITNNIVARHYNNATVKKYILGDFQVTGTLRFPWGATTVGTTTFFNHLTGGTDFTLMLYKGADLSAAVTGTAGQFTILMNVEADDAKTNSDEEMANEITFTGIYDGLSYPIRFFLCDGVIRDGFFGA